MNDKSQFYVPEAVRELAEKNVKQARSAYNQFVSLASQAQTTLSASQGAMTDGAMEMQAKALQYTVKNIDASFDFAADLARARDLKEYLEIQNRHARSQVEMYTNQARELSQMMTHLVQKSRDGSKKG